MKPHQEVWVAKRGWVALEQGNGIASFKSEGEGDDWRANEARARLAAEAPAMARLLIDVLNDPSFAGKLRVEAVLRAAGVPQEGPTDSTARPGPR